MNERAESVSESAEETEFDDVFIEEFDSIDLEPLEGYLEELPLAAIEVDIVEQAQEENQQSDDSLNVQRILDELQQLEELEDRDKEKRKQSAPLPPLPGFSTPFKKKSQPAMPILEASEKPQQNAPVDIQKMLEELKQLDEQVLKEREKKSVKVTGAFPALKSKQTGQFNLKDNYEISCMLAEASFIDGNELLAEGDRTGAIARYREALEYAPSNPAYTIKLAEELFKDESTAQEAQRIIAEAIEISPGNMELRMKFAQLKDSPSRTKRKSATAHLKYDRPAPKKEELMKTIEEQPSPTSTKGKETLESSEDETDNETVKLIRELAELESNPTVELNKKKKKRLRNFRSFGFAPGEIFSFDKLLPKSISNSSWAVLCFIFIVGMAGVVYKLSRHAEIKPLSPVNKMAISAQDIQFKWDCDKPNLSVAVEIYADGDLLMRKITKDKVFVPDPEQKALFRANQTYKWIVRTNPFINQSYVLKAEPQDFIINKAVELPSKNPQTIQSASQAAPNPEPQRMEFPSKIERRHE